jgi:hypothetical protein
MIEIGGQINIGGQVRIGPVPVFPDPFITENDLFLISETDQNFIDEQGPPYNV